MAVTVVLAMSSCSEKTVAPEKTWHQYLDDAKFLDMQDKHEEARSNYETAIAKLAGAEFEQDWRTELLARLARLDVLDGKLDLADKRTLEAIALNQDTKGHGPNHGETLVTLDDLAESYCERALKSKPDKNRCLEMVMKIVDKPSSARQEQLRSNSARDLAIEYIITGHKGKAAPLEKYVSDDAKERKKWSPLRDLATAYGYIGDQEKVDYYLELSKEILSKKKQSTIKTAYAMELAKLYRNNNRLDDAEKTLLDMLDSIKPQRGNGDMYEDVATIYGAKGEIEKAKEYWRLAIVEDTKRKSKEKLLRKRLDAYARYLRKINQPDEAKIIQQQADGMRDDDQEF